MTFHHPLIATLIVGAIAVPVGACGGTDSAEPPHQGTAQVQVRLADADQHAQSLQAVAAKVRKHAQLKRHNARVRAARKAATRRARAEAAAAAAVPDPIASGGSLEGNKDGNGVPPCKIDRQPGDGACSGNPYQDANPNNLPPEEGGVYPGTSGIGAD